MNSLNKTYFLDFYFPDLNIVIELDGSQHKNTVEKDKQRDNFVSKELKCDIIRITHKEYQSKSKIPLVKKLLGIGAS